MKVSLELTKTNFPMPAVLVTAQQENKLDISDCLGEKNKVDMKKCNPFVYWMSGGEYWEIGNKITTLREGKL